MQSIERKGSSLLAAIGLIAKYADQRDQVENIDEAFGSRHTTTNHGSELIGLGL